MISRKNSKRRANYQFNLKIHELIVPPNIRCKLPSDSSFYVVWTPSPDEIIESVNASIDAAPSAAATTTATTYSCSSNPSHFKEEENEENTIVWSDTEVLTIKCALIQHRSNGEFLSKPSRILLKQIHTDHQTHTTVGMANFDLANYVLCKEPTSIDIHFTKCNIANIYLEATINASLVNEENEEGETPTSATSTRAADAEELNLESNDSMNSSAPPLVDNVSSEDSIHRYSNGNASHSSSYENGHRKNNNIDKSVRQRAQLEAKSKILEDDNEELKIELQEITEKYNALLLKNKEMEKERNLLKGQLFEYASESKSVKAQNVQMQEQMSQNVKKYNELFRALSSSKNELVVKIAELCQQNDDLESTLVMVRNSWNQTASVMENQLNTVNSKNERLIKELNDLQSKYESMQPEFQMQEQIIENLQQQKMQMDTDISQLELKCATQNVEITQLKNQCAESQSRLEKIRELMLSLVQQGIIEMNKMEDATAAAAVVVPEQYNKTSDYGIDGIDGIDGAENSSYRHPRYSLRATQDIVDDILQHGSIKKNNERLSLASHFNTEKTSNKLPIKILDEGISTGSDVDNHSDDEEEEEDGYEREKCEVMQLID